MEFIKYKNLKMYIFMEVCYNNLYFPHLLEQGVSADIPFPGLPVGNLFLLKSFSLFPGAIE